MILSNIQKLRAAVDLAPTNWDLRLILAEALEEAGEDVLAYGQRYQAKEHRCPNFRPWSAYVSGLGLDVWEWWSIGQLDEDYLPPELFDSLKGFRAFGPIQYPDKRTVWKDYTTAVDADIALARALSVKKAE